MTPDKTPKPRRSRAWEIAAASGQRPLNLEARFSTGDGCFLAYAYLSYCRYDRGGVIELHFASRILRVEGRNLDELYAGLKKHAVAYIQESDAAGDDNPEEDGSVHKLEVTKEEED